MDQQKNLNLSALDEEKNIATSVHLSLASNDTISCESSQLEKMFLHQFDGHVVRKGTHLVLKYLGKKWQVLVKKITHDVDETDDKLSTEMESLTIDTKTTEHTYLFILSTTKICFDSSNKVPRDPSSLGLSDFGGGHEVVQEITKLCSSVLESSTTTSKSRVSFLIILAIVVNNNLYFQAEVPEES